MASNRLLDDNSNTWDTTCLTNPKGEKEESASASDNEEIKVKTRIPVSNVNTSTNNNSSLISINISPKEKRKLVQQKHSSRRNSANNIKDNNGMNPFFTDANNIKNNNNTIIDDMFGMSPTVGTIISPTPSSQCINTQSQLQHPSTALNITPCYSTNDANNPFLGFDSFFDDFAPSNNDNKMTLDSNKHAKKEILNPFGELSIATPSASNDVKNTKGPLLKLNSKHDDRKSNNNTDINTNNKKDTKEQKESSENSNTDSKNENDDSEGETHKPKQSSKQSQQEQIKDEEDVDSDENDNKKDGAITSTNAFQKYINKKRKSAPVGNISEITKKSKEDSIPERQKGVDLHSSGVGQRIDQATKQRPLVPVPVPVPVPPSTPTSTALEPPKKKYDVLSELKRGTALLKYGRHGYPHFRQFNLSEDNSKLVWFSSNKKIDQSSIDLKDISEVLTGQHTAEFRRIKWTTLAPASFSVIYDHGKTLNLVAKSVDEMKMWVEALRTLNELARKGENLQDLNKVEVEVCFRDRNRPQSRNRSGKFLRSNETNEKDVNQVTHRKLLEDIEQLSKSFQEVSRDGMNPIVQSSSECHSVHQILSELEERIDELREEVRNTRNTKIAENDVWRTKIDLESLKEKIHVIIKQNKNNYKSTKRRWSVF